MSREEDKIVERWKDEIDPEGAEAVEIMIARAMEERRKEENEPGGEIRRVVKWLGKLKRELEEEFQERDRIQAENLALRESLKAEREKTATLLRELEAAKRASERRKNHTWAWEGPGGEGSANRTAKGLRVAVTQAALELFEDDKRALLVADFNRIARTRGAPREVTLKCSTELEPAERHLWHVLEVAGSKEEWVVYDRMNEGQHLNHLRSVGAAFGMEFEIWKGAGKGEAEEWIMSCTQDVDALLTSRGIGLLRHNRRTGMVDPVPVCEVREKEGSGHWLLVRAGAEGSECVMYTLEDHGVGCPETGDVDFRRYTSNWGCNIPDRDRSGLSADDTAKFERVLGGIGTGPHCLEELRRDERLIVQRQARLRYPLSAYMRAARAAGRIVTEPNTVERYACWRFATMGRNGKAKSRGMP